MARLISLSFLESDTQLLASEVSGPSNIPVILANSASYPFVFPNMARSITMSSPDNNDFDFLISGTDQFGNSINEIMQGPNNNTVTSVNQYNTIVSIYSLITDYTNLSIGSGDTGTFQWIKFNTFNINPNITIAAEVVGTIAYSINQTIDSLGGYVTTGPFFRYVQPSAPVLLGHSPLQTTNGSSVVTVLVHSTTGLTTGDIVMIGGAEATGGIAPNALNIRAAITVLSDITFSYVAGAVSNANDIGGGTTVTYTFPPIPVSFPVTANLTNATTNQIYALNSPVTALQGVVNSSSAGGSLKINFLQQGII